MATHPIATELPPDAGTHERLLEAAVRLTFERGWGHVTMGKLAAEVGVSRQTVYNEIGSKPALAEAIVLRELADFLRVVNGAFDRHPNDLVEAIRDTVQSVLEHAQDNKLLHAAVSATHGADTDLLPLLTTHSQGLLDTAKAVVIERIKPYPLSLPTARLEAIIDMVVRVVLSHVMQPSATPAETADDLAWAASKVLA